ncbi:hypothetical protein QT971_30485 [Microcoleus sp. herbarium19]|uniref:hypothetical protein n=1 Tax=unclassified Microcoleus TaxID=2642155 RepID=UPI002FD08635
MNSKSIGYKRKTQALWVWLPGRIAFRKVMFFGKKNSNLLTLEKKREEKKLATDAMGDC